MADKKNNQSNSKNLDKYQEILKIERDLSYEILQADNLDHILSISLESVLKILEMDSGAIYLFDKEGVAQLSVKIGYPEDFINEIQFFKKDLINIINTKDNHHFHFDQEELNDKSILFDEEDIAQLEIFPISYKKKVLACFNITSRIKKETYPYSILAVETIASMLGTLIIEKSNENENRITHQNLESIYNALVDLLFILDLNGNIIHVNPSVTQCLEYQPEDLIGKHITTIFHTEKHNNVLNTLNRIISGEKNNCDIPLETKNGKLIPVMSYVNKSLWDGEQVLICLCKSIEKQIRTECALNESEERLRTLINAMPDIVCFKDGNGRWLEANEFDLKLFGLEGVDYRGKKDSELAEYSEFYREAFLYCEITDEETWKEGKPVRGDEVIPLPDGSKMIFDIIKVPTFDENLNRKGLVVVGRDVTDRKRTEEILKEREHRLSLISNLTTDLIYEWDVISEQFKWITDINLLLGYQPGEISNLLTDWLDIIHPQDLDTFNAIINHRKYKTESIIEEYRVKAKNGEWIYFRDFSNPVIVNEMPVKWIGGCKDITNQKKAEKILIENQRLSAIGEVASGVAHDFNNSIQMIFGNLDLALMSPDITPQIKEILQNIKQGASDAAARIRKLQRFSGKKRGEGERTFVDINQLIREVISQAQPLWKNEAQKKGIEINIIENYEEVPPVWINFHEIRSVFYNLIKNSMEALPNGGVIEFKTQIKEDKLHISVKDNGKGMDESTAKRVFQPFFSTKGYGGGRGLGLSSAYSILKEHGGNIYIHHTAPYEGTGFRIILPLPKTPKPQIIESEIPKDVKPLNILWVDDETMIRIVGKRQIELLGHKCSVAETGKQALRLLDERDFDLVITDLGMPEMSGWELAKHVRDKFGDKIKIITLTGWGSDIKNNHSNHELVDRVLGKPIDTNVLGQIIAEISQDINKGHTKE